MNPHFQQKTLFTIINKQTKEKLAELTFNESTEGFHDAEDFQMYIIKNSGIYINENIVFEAEIELLYFDIKKQEFEIHSQSFSSEPIGDLGIFFNGLFEYFDGFSHRLTKDCIEKNKSEMENDLDAILAMGDEYEEEEDDDNPFKNANADELEEEKEQLNPNSHLAHPRTEEAVLEQSFQGYSSEMTVDTEPPQPQLQLNPKLQIAVANTLLVCAMLSAMFITAGLGAMALHQVKTLF